MEYYLLKRGEGKRMDQVTDKKGMNSLKGLYRKKEYTKSMFLNIGTLWKMPPDPS